MTTEQAFNHLIQNWESLPDDFRHKYRTYKSRYLNKSGNQVKKVGRDVMEQMLLEAGYTVKPEIWKKPKKL